MMSWSSTLWQSILLSLLPSSVSFMDASFVTCLPGVFSASRSRGTFAFVPRHRECPAWTQPPPSLRLLQRNTEGSPGLDRSVGLRRGEPLRALLPETVRLRDD